MQQIVYIASPESQQIHVWLLDEQGRMTLQQVVDVGAQVQPLLASPDGRLLYTGVKAEPRIIAWLIGEQGKLTLAGEADVPGGPTYLAFDASGRFIYSAAYHQHCVSVTPLDEHGLPKAPVCVIHDLPHCHSVRMNPWDHAVWVACLGDDRLRLFTQQPDGWLEPRKDTLLHTAPGAGPRHILFHPHQPWAYCINELNGTVDVWPGELPPGEHSPLQTLDCLPADFDGKRWTADLHLTPDGRYLYCSERTTSQLIQFGVSASGDSLQRIGFYPTETQPRGFAIDGEGRYLIAAGQKSNHIALSRIDPDNGRLTEQARYRVGEGPMWVTVIACPEM